FSSRRRHTRSKRDWSSDVCSSDLSLDPEMVRGVLDIMQRLSDNEHMTMIIVTHEMNFAARIADKVLFLEDGKILEETPGKEFFTKPQTKRAQEFFESMDF